MDLMRLLRGLSGNSIVGESQRKADSGKMSIRALIEPLIGRILLLDKNAESVFLSNMWRGVPI